MKSVLTILMSGTFLVFSMSSCSSPGSSVATAGPTGLSEDAKHRLYAAALASSESPMESETFKDVCRKIGIFDTQGNQNDKYMAFVTAHIEWALKAENDRFKLEINTREKALKYLKKYLP